GILIVNEQTFSIKLPKSWIPLSSTGMTPSFFLDPSSQGTGMTRKGLLG
ncbi:hypothetical protein WANA13_0812, partial [Wolbachia endosymbiont of Drosophila ananassae]